LSFYAELKRRNVFRVAAGYVVLSWLLLQVADVLKDTIGLPDIWSRAVLGLLVIGFLPALIFSWIYEMTPEGLKREKDIAREVSITAHTARKLDIAVIVLLLVAIGVFAFDRYVGAPPDNTGSSSRAAAPSGQVPVVAVLPLQALSTDDEGRFLASGLHDDLLTRLARLQSFRVISRTSVMEYANTTMNLRDIGLALGANFILEGGLQAIGGNVRINAQLIDAATDEHLWADTYNRSLTTANLFEVQADIAGAIAEALHATLSPHEIAQLGGVPTKNLEAYEAFLRGQDQRDLLTMPAIHGSVSAYREAVRLDPEFGEAWAGLTLALIRQYWEEGAEDGAAPDDALVDEARIALQHAQQIDPGSASTFMAEAYFHYYAFRDYSSALIALGRAQAIAPNDYRVSSLHGYLLRRLGRSSDAADALLLSRQLNPNDRSLYRETSDTLRAAGRCDEASTLVSDGLRRYPDDEGMLGAYAWIAMTCRRDLGIAAEYARKIEVSTLQQLQSVTELLFYAGDYASAIEILLAAKNDWAKRPTVQLLVDNYLVLLYRQSGQDAKAAEALQSAKVTAAEVTDKGLTSLSELMTLEALQGNQESVQRLGVAALVARPDDAWRAPDYSYQVARNYALAGLDDKALETLEGIRFDYSYDSLVRLDVDPVFERLRDDPRMLQIRAKGEVQVKAALSASITASL